MSVIVNGNTLKNLSYNNNQAKIWIHNGVEVWRAIKTITLVSSSYAGDGWLQSSEQHATIPGSYSTAIPSDWSSYFSVSGITITAKKQIQVSNGGCAVSCYGGSGGGGAHNFYTYDNGTKRWAGSVSSVRGEKPGVITQGSFSNFSYTIQPGKTFYMTSYYSGGKNSWIYPIIRITITAQS